MGALACTLLPGPQAAHTQQAATSARQKSQTSTQRPSETKPSPARSQPAAPISAQPPSACGVAPVTTAKAPEPKITAAQAQELFRSVDEILRFVSADTGLPIKSTVKRQLASRDDVQKYLEERLDDDEDARRLDRSELVLKKFGLLPHDFHLRTFMVQLLREQVAGFYDPKRKTVFLLDWLPPDSQKAVLAHELTHALQDQDVGLEAWSKTPKPVGTTTVERDNSEIAVDEDSSARSAVAEGQGMAVLVDYFLKPSGRTVADAPQVVDAMRAQMGTDDGSSPTLTCAPIMLRESLMFPYRDGLGFIQALLTPDAAAQRGNESAQQEAQREAHRRAYTGVLASPPRDSRQILMPATYIAGEHVTPVRLPEMPSLLGPHYTRYDVGAMGQFDIHLLLAQFAPDAKSEAGADNQAAAQTALEEAWRGGAYYAALKVPASGKPGSDSVTKQGSGEPPQTSDLALVYLQRFSTAEAAQCFAAFYASALKRRYEYVARESDGLGADALGSTAGSPRAAQNSKAQNAQSSTEHGRPTTDHGQLKTDNLQRFSTSEGEVSIGWQGSSVLILEGLDEAAAARVQAAVLPGNLVKARVLHSFALNAALKRRSSTVAGLRARSKIIGDGARLSHGESNGEQSIAHSDELSLGVVRRFWALPITLLPRLPRHP